MRDSLRGLGGGGARAGIPALQRDLGQAIGAFGAGRDDQFQERGRRALGFQVPEGDSALLDRGVRDGRTDAVRAAQGDVAGHLERQRQVAPGDRLRAGQFLAKGIGDLLRVLDKVRLASTGVGQRDEQLLVKVQAQAHSADHDPGPLGPPCPGAGLALVLCIAVGKHDHAAGGVGGRTAGCTGLWYSRCARNRHSLDLLVSHGHAARHIGFVAEVDAVQAIDGLDQLALARPWGAADHEQGVLGKGDQRVAILGAQQVGHGAQRLLGKVHVAGGLDAEALGDVKLPDLDAIHRLLPGHAHRTQPLELLVGEDGDGHGSTGVDHQAQVDGRALCALRFAGFDLDQGVDQVPLVGDGDIGIDRA